MGDESHRLNLTLDAERAERLKRLAERTHLQEGTLARSLLSAAIDEADTDPRNVVELLDGIAGAYERAQLSRRQIRTGEGIALEQLARAVRALASSSARQRQPTSPNSSGSTACRRTRRTGWHVFSRACRRSRTWASGSVGAGKGRATSWGRGRGC